MTQRSPLSPGVAAFVRPNNLMSDRIDELAGNVEFEPSGDAAQSAQSAPLAVWSPSASSISTEPRSWWFIIDGKLVSVPMATMIRLLWDQFMRSPPQPNEAYTRLGPTNHVVLPSFNIPQSMPYPKWDNDFNRALWRHAKNNVPNANALYFEIERSEAEGRPTPLAMKYAALLLARLRGLNIPLNAANRVQLNESIAIPWNRSLALPSTPSAYTLGGVEVWDPVNSFPGAGSTGGTPANLPIPGAPAGTGGGGGSSPAPPATTLVPTKPQGMSNTMIAVIAIAVVVALGLLWSTTRRAR
jgi:hypothetical protein